VYLVSFDPTIGAEIQKTRPALIIQNDVGNRYSPLTIVAAITSHHGGGPYPHQVLVGAPEGGLQADSAILLNQVRSVDKQRLVRRLGVLKAETLAKVDRALQISLGLIVI
jgi:mRNA interferase MazF